MSWQVQAEAVFWQHTSEQSLPDTCLQVIAYRGQRDFRPKVNKLFSVVSRNYFLIKQILYQRRRYVILNVSHKDLYDLDILSQTSIVSSKSDKTVIIVVSATRV